MKKIYVVISDGNIQITMKNYQGRTLGKKIDFFFIEIGMCDVQFSIKTGFFKHFGSVDTVYIEKISFQIEVKIFDFLSFSLSDFIIFLSQGGVRCRSRESPMCCCDSN